ncbi:g1814 [Coccomyxa viridis]|uniref:G1814 protein n=1 Tax=Coccomyxa viridis TaxID=1274662 RepID=A0ABP1FIV4_9CHLO
MTRGTVAGCKTCGRAAAAIASPVAMPCTAVSPICWRSPRRLCLGARAAELPQSANNKQQHQHQQDNRGDMPIEPAQEMANALSSTKRHA